MWHVATAAAAVLAPANALHSSQDIRYFSTFRTGNPIGTWQFSILNFAFVFYFYITSSSLYFELLKFCFSLQKKNKYRMYVEFHSFFLCFSIFSFSFLWKLQKKNIQRTLSVLFLSLVFVLENVSTKSISRFSVGFGLRESADTKRTPRANETQCEQQVRVQMRLRLDATVRRLPMQHEHVRTCCARRCYDAVNQRRLC